LEIIGLLRTGEVTPPLRFTNKRKSLIERGLDNAVRNIRGEMVDIVSMQLKFKIKL